MWLIIQVWSTSKPKLNCQDLPNQVRFMMKIGQDNELIDHISVLYTENDTELS